MKRLLAAGLCALALAACSTISQVPPGERTVINGQLAVQPAHIWSKVTHYIPVSSVSVWTMDGVHLNKLCFIAGLENGQSIHNDLPARQPEPKFRSTMGPQEVMELFASGLARQTTSPVMVKTSGLRPEKFAGVNGFRFDFTLVDQADDVERRGVAVGAVHRGKLFLIFYHGARINFFGKNLPEVETIIRSAQLM